MPPHSLGISLSSIAPDHDQYNVQTGKSRRPIAIRRAIQSILKKSTPANNTDTVSLADSAVSSQHKGNRYETTFHEQTGGQVVTHPEACSNVEGGQEITNAPALTDDETSEDEEKGEVDAEDPASSLTWPEYEPLDGSAECPGAPLLAPLSAPPSPLSHTFDLECLFPDDARFAKATATDIQDEDPASAESEDEFVSSPMECPGAPLFASLPSPPASVIRVLNAEGVFTEEVESGAAINTNDPHDWSGELEYDLAHGLMECPGAPLLPSISVLPTPPASVVRVWKIEGTFSEEIEGEATENPEGEHNWFSELDYDLAHGLMECPGAPLLPSLSVFPSPTICALEFGDIFPE